MKIQEGDQRVVFGDLRHGAEVVEPEGIQDFTFVKVRDDYRYRLEDREFEDSVEMERLSFGSGPLSQTIQAGEQYVLRWLGGSKVFRRGENAPYVRYLPNISNQPTLLDCSGMVADPDRYRSGILRVKLEPFASGINPTIK